MKPHIVCAHFLEFDTAEFENWRALGNPAHVSRASDAEHATTESTENAWIFKNVPEAEIGCKEFLKRFPTIKLAVVPLEDYQLWLDTRIDIRDKRIESSVDWKNFDFKPFMYKKF